MKDIKTPALKALWTPDRLYVDLEGDFQIFYEVPKVLGISLGINHVLRRHLAPKLKNLVDKHRVGIVFEGSYQGNVQRLEVYVIEEGAGGDVLKPNLISDLGTIPYCLRKPIFTNPYEGAISDAHVRMGIGPRTSAEEIFEFEDWKTIRTAVQTYGDLSVPKWDALDRKIELFAT